MEASYDGANLADQLTEAVLYITGRYNEAELPEVGDDVPSQKTIPADPSVKNYSFTVVNGEVYYRQNSVMVQPDLGKGLVNLRGIVNDLIQAQMDNAPDEAIEMQQRRLNDAYDAFSAKYGLISSRGNANVFSSDASYYLLCSLEIVNEKGELERKADMFTKRTIRHSTPVTHVDTPAEALAVSITEKARVDLPFMAELTGMDEEEIATNICLAMSVRNCGKRKTLRKCLHILISMFRRFRQRSPKIWKLLRLMCVLVLPGWTRSI